MVSKYINNKDEADDVLFNPLFGIDSGDDKKKMIEDISKNVTENINKMGKKIIAAKNILKGAIVLESDLAYKSPGDGISPAQSEAIIGRTALREIVVGESLRFSDVN